ncbi:hypothetical protein H5S09_04285 [Limosilactobacillus sp. STM2_1]|uniref:Uncharacterized protein n=1 Tax=Limosilactobacillus rudii TaxID=2759755 RepID=A0A7W3UKB7_9LACO|nr:hypothetical protein [Limosilactobacillus rudii]MBB1078981.1 hypothetical protein [Limosilactobacillus rudii]MBB1097162.1 hypothetical protein [Limosilactobacillus rudii]MCD7134155.1 hypothetical protein [Limosilactobacillus rudii]
MHDQVLVALISTIGSIVVAYLTTHQSKKPSVNDELVRENEKLKKQLEEKQREDT